MPRDIVERFDIEAALQEVAGEQLNMQELLDQAPREGDDVVMEEVAQDIKQKQEGNTAPASIDDVVPPEPIQEPDDYRVREAQLQAQFEAYTRAAEQRLQEQLRNIQPQVKEEKQAATEDDFVDPLQTIRDLQQQVSMLAQQNEIRGQQDLRNRFDRAVDSVKEKYPDLLDHLPRQALEQGLRYAIENRDMAADFAQQIDLAYKLTRFDAVHKQAQELSAHKQESDELAPKRAEKRQAASAVSGGGGTYQQPEFKITDGSMRSGKKDFLADYLASGG